MARARRVMATVRRRLEVKVRVRREGEGDGEGLEGGWR